MAVPALPALVGAGRTAITAALPKAVEMLKQQYPDVAAKMDATMGLQNVSATQVAKTAQKRGDGVLASMVIEEAFRAGATPRQLASMIPALTEQELANFQAEVLRVTTAREEVVDRTALDMGSNRDVRGEADEIATANTIERLCRGLAISSDMLKDLMVFIRTSGPKHVEQYQRNERARNRIPV